MSFRSDCASSTTMTFAIGPGLLPERRARQKCNGAATVGEGRRVLRSRSVQRRMTCPACERAASAWGGVDTGRRVGHASLTRARMGAGGADI